MTRRTRQHGGTERTSNYLGHEAFQMQRKIISRFEHAVRRLLECALDAVAKTAAEAHNKNSKKKWRKFQRNGITAKVFNRTCAIIGDWAQASSAFWTINKIIYWCFWSLLPLLLFLLKISHFQSASVSFFSFRFGWHTAHPCCSKSKYCIKCTRARALAHQQRNKNMKFSLLDECKFNANCVLLIIIHSKSAEVEEHRRWKGEKLRINFQQK